MKFVKQFAILIVALVAILLIVALFIKKDYSVSRTIAIERSSEDIYDYIKYFDNMENYATWQMKDPSIEQKIVGPDGNVGAIFYWNSENKAIGSGEQEIVQMIENSQIDYSLIFNAPFEMQAESFFKLTPNEEEEYTALTWGINGRKPWPWNLTLLFVDPDKELGSDLEKSIKNLKDILEME